MKTNLHWIALLLGVVQGYVGVIFFIFLVPLFARRILDVEQASRISIAITNIIAFIFLMLAFFSVAGYWLDVFAAGTDLRQELGNYWRGGLIIGFIMWGIVIGTEKRFRAKNERKSNK